MTPESDQLEHRMVFGPLPSGVETLELVAAVGTNTARESDHGPVLGFGLAAEHLFNALNYSSGREAEPNPRLRCTWTR